MIKFDVFNRQTGLLQFTAEIDCAEAVPTSIKLSLAVRWAIRTGANLAGANLAGADLTGAYLAGAYLADADLAGAYLARANLARANLAGAYLADAYLTDTDLTDANLAGANLARADLAGAYLTDTNLTDAYLTDANLAGTDLADTIDEKNIPIIPQIDAAILNAIEAGGTLDMGTWHGSEGWCGTTHCRAGWAIHLAGQRGRDLEQKYGPRTAGALIYRASRPNQPAPWFFAPQDKALADIRKCAAAQTANPEEAT